MQISGTIVAAAGTVLGVGSALGTGERDEGGLRAGRPPSVRRRPPSGRAIRCRSRFRSRCRGIISTHTRGLRAVGAAALVGRQPRTQQQRAVVVVLADQITLAVGQLVADSSRASTPR
jgi:hypothetical protein